MVVLKAFGFSHNFVNLIHQCLSSVEFTLLLNGGLGPSFSPSRGLRQGDPLSPYLFILGNEVLMRLINREVSQKNLTGFKVSNTAPPISKLCYADDILLFCKAKSSELVILRSCLEKFSSWSGQFISVEKSSCFPSKGVSPQFMNQVKCCWGLNTLPQSTTYLGVPLFLSKSKSQDFDYVKERLDSKLKGWKSKNLSWSGRATLIKSVAQAIPTYSMSATLLPKGLSDQLDASVHRFWWRPKSNASSYWSPMSWSSLCLPQKEGGLGFRKFWDFNQALLSKLGWWILSRKVCLCIKVLTAKYKIRDNWLAHHSPSNASPLLEKLDRHKTPYCKGSFPFSR